MDSYHFTSQWVIMKCHHQHWLSGNWCPSMAPCHSLVPKRDHVFTGTWGSRHQEPLMCSAVTPASRKLLWPVASQRPSEGLSCLRSTPCLSSCCSISNTLSSSSKADLPVIARAPSPAPQTSSQEGHGGHCTSSSCKVFSEEPSPSRFPHGHLPDTPAWLRA